MLEEFPRGSPHIQRTSFEASRDIAHQSGEKTANNESNNNEDDDDENDDSDDDHDHDNDDDDDDHEDEDVDEDESGKTMTVTRTVTRTMKIENLDIGLTYVKANEKWTMLIAKNVQEQ